MDLIDFRQNALWLNLTTFAAAAAIVWLAGTRLSQYANAIAEQTGIGKAFLGALLLGGITSLPEFATTGTAAAAANAPLAVNNLLGGIAMQVAVLALADAVLGRDALSSVIARPVVLLLATLDVLLLVMVAVGITVGDVALLGVGGWTIAVLLLYVISIWLVRKYEAAPAWEIRDRPAPAGPRQVAATRAGGRELNRVVMEPTHDAQKVQASTARLVLYTVAASVAILGGGFVLARTADAVALQTGLGASFIGAALLPIATSLPEMSTVIAAMRIRQYEMAFSNIFGTNLFDVSMVFFVDAIYAGAPVLNEVGRFSVVAALLGAATTTVYLAGLIERRDRTVLRMGFDSLVVLVIYFGGVFLLYRLR
ncbi:MAG: sodium:calcium antiporter [Longimicrobiales bacterium]